MFSHNLDLDLDLGLVQTGVPLASNKVRVSHFLMGAAPILLHVSQVKIKN